jgi:multicomponent Na+:H+ antiporter subunit E
MMLFSLNLLLALLWTVLTRTSNEKTLLIGFLIGYAILAIFNRSYGRRGIYLIIFLVNLIWQVIISSVELAWTLVQPTLKLSPGIVAIPLDVTNDFQIATLASAITLTPGTLSVDLGRDKDTGKKVLFVHTIFMGDPQKLREQIKGGFERYILEISQEGETN